MSGRWLRLYDDLVDDPKVQRLTADQFRALVNLWCLASRNDGVLPSVPDMAFGLRISITKVRAHLFNLVAAGLIDETDNGLMPHNWGGRQYESDSSAERMRRHRARKRDNQVTSPVTAGDVTSDAVEQIQNRTEQNRADKKDSSANALSILQTVLDSERARAIIEHRRKKRSPLTDHTAELLIKQLTKWPDANAAADEMLLRGWLSFKPEWMVNGHGHGPPVQHMSAKERAMERVQDVGANLLERARYKDGQRD